MNWFILMATLVLAWICVGCAPDTQESPSDTAVHAPRDVFDQAIAPYLAQARASYPDARRRFLAGLPRAHVFFVTTRLIEGSESEDPFVQVDAIQDGQIHGRIGSTMARVKSFKRGDPVTFPESAVMDWTITKPDGTEEGNAVGKFLRTWDLRNACTISQC
jgi:hypothetical protein